jgi:hypothetical protein
MGRSRIAPRAASVSDLQFAEEGGRQIDLAVVIVRRRRRRRRRASGGAGATARGHTDDGGAHIAPTNQPGTSMMGHKAPSQLSQP